MAMVELAKLCFAFVDQVPLLGSVDAHLVDGWHGVVGPNGAGKTTLLRLVAGDLAPDGGKVRVLPGSSRVVLCAQRIDDVPEGTASLASSRDPDAARLKDRLGLAPDQLERWSTLSPGERKRWQIGSALHVEPDVLLLDEPTNHLDGEAKRDLVRSLAGFDGVGLVVSHDRELLDALTSTTLGLKDGALVAYPGPYSEARAHWAAEAERKVALKKRRRDAERSAARRLDGARRSQEQAVRQLSAKARMKSRKDHDGRSAGAKARARKAEARKSRQVALARRTAERASDEVSAVEVERQLGAAVFAQYTPCPRRWLCRHEAAEIGAGDKTILRDVSVAIERGARVRVAGANGAGKTTLLTALVQAIDLPSEHIVVLPQTLTPAAERAWLDRVRSLPRASRGRVLSVMAALGVDPDRLLRSQAPSPGEARKLAIAFGLGVHAWLLVLDEPTNHLDLPSVERIEAALTAFPGALVLVSHDERLATRCTDRTLLVENGRIAEIGQRAASQRPDA